MSAWFRSILWGLSWTTVLAADWEWRNARVETLPDGGQRVRLVGESDNPALLPPTIRVVVSSTWLAGLVPVFEVEREGRFELRRRPMTGRENVHDPLFFALPPNSDPDALLLAGLWQIQATNQHGGRHWTSFELTSEQGKVAGRFDQNTDYRFAFLTGGEWKTNHLRIDVEYIQDRYELSAQWQSNRLTGTWRRPDDSEQGTWVGKRTLLEDSPNIATPAQALWEWRHADGRRRYGIDPAWKEDGWNRQSEPVCRVWRP